MKGHQALAREATRAAEFRGHRLGTWRWANYTNAGRVFGCARCQDCQAEAQIDTRPEANGIDISGEAVALGCRSEDAA